MTATAISGTATTAVPLTTPSAPMPNATSMGRSISSPRPP